MEATMNKEEKAVERAVISGSGSEVIAGAAALVLAIIGLGNVDPPLMMSISAIALGAAMVISGATVVAEYSRILAHSGNGTIQKAELGGGISTQIAGGIAALILGVLALLGLSPVVLMAIAIIVLGATMAFSSGVSARLNAFKIEASGDEDLAKRVAREAMTAATGTQLLVGVAAVVLGILAVAAVDPVTLILVAMLALGASILLEGTAVVGKMMSIFGI